MCRLAHKTPFQSIIPLERTQKPDVKVMNPVENHKLIIQALALEKSHVNDSSHLFKKVFFETTSGFFGKWFDLRQTYWRISNSIIDSFLPRRADVYETVPGPADKVGKL